MAPSSDVHDVLASHLGPRADVIEDGHRLGPDLGLASLDLAMIGLRLEARGSGRGELPLAIVDGDMTVRELRLLYAAWCASGETNRESYDDLEVDLEQDLERDLDEENGPDTLRTPVPLLAG